MTENVKGGNRKGEGGRKATASLLPPSPFPLPPFLIAFAAGIGLTWIFWAPLWEGGSLIGGDLFPYFFPQKVFLAEQLRAGVIPLWNPLTGHGYPTIAESQTGVYYPPDLLAYRFLSVTTAYNAVQLLHYVFGFLGTWALARKLGCTNAGALLAGLSFIYGWFAPRICLEWAMVTGAYLPWTMWCAESYLQRPRMRFLVALCLLLSLQLLAGHFHLAFITQLALVIYAPLRWRLLPPSPLEGEGPGVVVGTLRVPNLRTRKLRTTDQELRPPSPSRGDGNTSRSWLAIWGAILVAFSLAAVQLAPTWELKQRSQRAGVSEEHQPGYGHLPPQYWTQAVIPWVWYAGDIDAALSKLPNYAGGAGTNRVEAHLYFGLLPLLLAVGGWLVNWRSRAEPDRVLRLWLLLGFLFLLYTPGWFLPITQFLPGFNFFRGPGRYGIMTSLSIALMAGATFSRVRLRFAGPPRSLFTLLVFAVTCADLWWVAQRVGYSLMLDHPLVERRLESPIRQFLMREQQPVRLFAPMANVANLLDVSSTPVYLGIGPAEYFDPRFTMPTGPQGGLDLAGDPAQIHWLQQAGVTHILSLDRLNTRNWPVDLQWTGFDSFLHVVFNRVSHEPFYLYRLRDSRGRISWDEPAANGQAEITQYAAHRIQAHCVSSSGGKIILTELAYPGWRVQVDGQPAPSESSGMFRAVTVGPGEHELIWSYHPPSLYWGGVISTVTLIGLLSASIFRRPNGESDRQLSKPLLL